MSDSDPQRYRSGPGAPAPGPQRTAKPLRKVTAVIHIIPQNGGVQKSVDQERLMKPSEVAALFRVDLQTVGRWGRKGRLASVMTPGGQRRFPENAVLALLAGVRA